MKSKDEFDRRFGEAKRERDTVADDLRELYSFLFNGREREWDQNRRKQEPEEIFSATAADANLEFTGDLFSYATPESQAWVEYEVGVAVPEEHVEQVTEIVQAREQHLTDAVRSSNYYDVGHQCFQEAGIGLVAAHCERPTLSAAIEFEPVPMSQLFLLSGARGIEDRFRCRQVFARDIKLLFPDFTPSRKLKAKIEDGDACQVKQGWWRNYDDPGNFRWVYQAKVENELAADEKDLGGPGACPLLVGRFNPVPGTPWPRGPAWLMLPEIRTENALREMVLNKLGQIVDPAYVYIRDGLLDLSEGIEQGYAYPAMPGTAEQIKAIGADGNMDYGLFSLDDLERRIRRGFYRQEEQRGKTPPSATQFAGESLDIIRRMGRPGASVFNEFVRDMLQRVEFLEVRDRDLEQQILVGSDIISVSAVSPLIRAQGREAVVQAQGIMQAAVAALGEEEASVLIDGTTTMRSIKERLGDDLVQFRSQEDITKILQQRQAAMQQQQQVPQ